MLCNSSDYFVQLWFMPFLAFLAKPARRRKSVVESLDLQLDESDIAIEDRVAVVLQVQRPLARGILEVIVDLDAVVQDRHARALLLRFRIDRLAAELDIVGLPGERRIAHIHAR